MELSDKIKEFIAPIKQHIEADGGSVEFIEVTEDLIVKIKLSGSVKPCEDCPDPMKYCTPCIMDTRHLKKEYQMLPYDLLGEVICGQWITLN